jgi:hypothetical protein
MKLGYNGNFNHPMGDSPPDDDPTKDVLESCREWVKHQDDMEELESYLYSEYSIDKDQIKEILSQHD